MDRNYKFKDIEYVRPDFSEMGRIVKEYAAKIENSASYDEAKCAYLEFDKIEAAFNEIGRAHV